MPPAIDLLAATRALAAADARLAGIIARVGPCRLEARDAARREGGAYASLVEIIVSQQLSSRAADTIFARLAARAEGADGAAITPSAIARLDDGALRAAGLSGAKVAAVRDLTRRVLDRSLDPDGLSTLPDEAILASLRRVRGIGPWSVDMFLLFHLGRPDVWPVGDLGIQNAVKKLCRLRGPVTAAALERVARPWRPFRSVAAWYLWRSLELAPPAWSPAARDVVAARPVRPRRTGGAPGC